MSDQNNRWQRLSYFTLRTRWISSWNFLIVIISMQTRRSLFHSNRNPDLFSDDVKISMRIDFCFPLIPNLESLKFKRKRSKLIEMTLLWSLNRPSKREDWWGVEFYRQKNQYQQISSLFQIRSYWIFISIFKLIGREENNCLSFFSQSVLMKRNTILYRQDAPIMIDVFLRDFFCSQSVKTVSKWNFIALKPAGTHFFPTDCDDWSKLTDAKSVFSILNACLSSRLIVKTTSSTRLMHFHYWRSEGRNWARQKHHFLYFHQRSVNQIKTHVVDAAKL